MTPLAIDALAAVRAVGGDVKLAGPGRLKVVASAPLPIDLIERLRAAKPDLLDLLQNQVETNFGASANWTDVEEERGADGHTPRACAEALARLDPANPPRDVPLPRWHLFLDDCGHFLRNGWAKSEIAKASRIAPLSLYDHFKAAVDQALPVKGHGVYVRL